MDKLALVEIALMVKLALVDLALQLLLPTCLEQSITYCL